MKNRLGCQEAEAIQDWLEFAGDIADGTETDYERELDDIMRALSYVRNNFSPDVLQKSVRFPTLANEIIYGAACLPPAWRKSRWPGLPGTAGWKMDMSLPQMMKQGRCLWYGLRIQKSRFSWL